MTWHARSDQVGRMVRSRAAPDRHRPPIEVALDRWPVPIWGCPRSDGGNALDFPRYGTSRGMHSVPVLLCFVVVWYRPILPIYYRSLWKKKCPSIGDAIPKNGDNWSNCSSRNSPVSWGQHGTHLGPTGPRWAPCWSHELCYLGQCRAVITQSVFSKILPTGTPQRAHEGEVWGVFSEYKRWFRWCVAHCSTICNIMLYLSAL